MVWRRAVIATVIRYLFTGIFVIAGCLIVLLIGVVVCERIVNSLP